MEHDASRSEPETLALRRLQTAMNDAESALAQRMRMHPTDLAAMSFLTWADDPAGPTDLAHRLGLSPAAATEVVDRLTSAGHVERHRDLADRRRIRLQPSGDAVATVMGEIGPLIAALDAVAGGYAPEERAVIADFLHRAIGVYEHWSGADEE